MVQSGPLGYILFLIINLFHSLNEDVIFCSIHFCSNLYHLHFQSYFSLSLSPFDIQYISPHSTFFLIPLPCFVFFLPSHPLLFHSFSVPPASLISLSISLSVSRIFHSSSSYGPTFCLGDPIFPACISRLFCLYKHSILINFTCTENISLSISPFLFSLKRLPFPALSLSLPLFVFRFCVFLSH